MTCRSLTSAMCAFVPIALTLAAPAMAQTAPLFPYCLARDSQCVVQSIEAQRMWQEQKRLQAEIDELRQQMQWQRSAR